jgi:serine/threonine-protein kinase
MASRSSPDIERRALALFERLADHLGHTGFRERLLKREPEAVRARVAALEASVTRAAGAIPTIVPGSGDLGGTALPPHKLGAFRVGDRLGRGGMGEVWLGERDDGLYEQKVAIKLIQRRVLARAGAAFDEERRILARLEHPNIARLIDGGVTEDGLPWLAMEYIDGEPLDTACEGKSALERVTMVIKAADAVQYAHSRMIAHADLKPSNIYVDRSGRVKLLDFGISGLIGAARPASGTSEPVTRDFASPERLAGAGPSVGDDVFALGKTLGLVLPPGQEPELAAIAAKARAPLEADRYGSVAELIADLDRWRQHLPVAAMPGGWRYRAAKFVARHKTGVVATVLAMLVLAVAAVLATSNWLRAERNRASAEQRFGQVRQLSHYMLFDLYDQLAREPGTVAKRLQLAQTSAGYLTRLQVAPDAPADLRLDVARSFRRLAAIQGLPGVSSLGRPQQAVKSLDRAEALLRPLVAEQPDNAAAIAELGWVLADRWSLHGDDPSSPSANAKARAAFDRALAADPANVSAALGRITTLRNQGYDLIWAADKPAQAQPVLRAALSNLRAKQWPAPWRDAAWQLEINILNRLGDAHYNAGDTPGSLPFFEEADRLVDKGLAREGATPRWLILKGENAFNISGTLQEIPGRRDRALAVARAAQGPLKQLLAVGPDAAAEKRLLVLYGQEAALLDDAGRIEDALVPSHASVALRRERLAHSPGDPQRMRDLAIGVVPYAELLGKAGKKAEACAAAKDAVAGWAAIKRAGLLGARDANKNMPKAESLQAKFCG